MRCLKSLRLATACMAVLVAVAGCSSSPKAAANTITAPKNVAAAFQSTQNSKYVFYAPAGKVPSWDAVASAGIYVCSESRPPLISASDAANLDSGSIPDGTEVTLKDSAITTGLGLKQVIITVPAAVNGCTPLAYRQALDHPGMLMLTDAKATFPEQSKMVKVQIK